MSEPGFLDLPDLASETVGGAAIACNDEFFAEKENLLKPAAAVWKDHLYTDRGKWMDGWETRRFRPIDGVAPGPDSTIHDWCLIRLGLPGVIRGIVVDTAWFRGNYPASCAIHATEIDDPLDLLALETATWTELLPRSPLQGDSKNMFEIDSRARFTHLRLEIFPDGGVARLRIHGHAVPQWSRVRALGGAIDLAALENGAVVETCSDMFFGSRNNLIKAGPSLSMADGWETRRRRGPGNDWAIIRLAAAGTIERLLLDTSHFKGNAPARASIEGVHAPGVAVDKLTGWRTLLSTAMQAHTRHTFDDELRRIGPVTHLRLSVYPCGGVARLRAWGVLAGDAADGISRLNALSSVEARAALRRTNGSTAWATAMTAARPFEDMTAVLRTAERVWWSLGEAEHREAFGAHARIGEAKVPAHGDAAWSTDEQKEAASAAATTLAELADANREYDAKHGFLFIVCASGRSADAMLADLRARLGNTAADELRTAAEEQMKITRLRLAKLIGELG
ncbi:MAG: allantoicase [Deltaproteobacteria bacterium]|nr:allantoicase [Deltaproteobacteria bacterium]